MAVNPNVWVWGLHGPESLGAVAKGGLRSCVARVGKSTAETVQLDLWLELSSIRNRVKGPEWDRD